MAAQYLTLEKGLKYIVIYTYNHKSIYNQIRLRRLRVVVTSERFHERRY